MGIYKIISAIGIFIRQFCLPNPFDVLGDGVRLGGENGQILLSPSLLNLVAECLLHPFTYFIVGLYYDRGSEPAIGSLLYMFFYAVHVGILSLLMSRVYPSIFLIIIILATYVSLHILIVSRLDMT